MLQSVALFLSRFQFSNLPPQIRKHSDCNGPCLQSLFWLSPHCSWPRLMLLGDSSMMHSQQCPQNAISNLLPWTNSACLTLFWTQGPLTFFSTTRCFKLPASATGASICPHPAGNLHIPWAPQDKTFSCQQIVVRAPDRDFHTGNAPHLFPPCCCVHSDLLNKHLLRSHLVSGVTQRDRNIKQEWVYFLTAMSSFCQWGQHRGEQADLRHRQVCLWEPDSIHIWTYDPLDFTCSLSKCV